MVATGHFTFDLMGPLIDQLDTTFTLLTPDPLSMDNLALVAASPGVYQLWHQGVRVYVGKADLDLQGRLQGHLRKIAARTNIRIADVSFLGLYLEATWIPVGAERGLIERFGGGAGGVGLPWNKNGFGINDPGKERDTTNFGATHFDVLYPADLDFKIPGITSGMYRLSELIQLVKAALPYVFRYENQWARHPDYEVTVEIVQQPATARTVFESLADALPSGWQITALPGYVIMYKAVRSFPSARETWLS